MDNLQIISGPSKEEWDEVMRECMTAHINQSWEWGEIYGQKKGIIPIRLIAKQNGKPVGILQAFEWKIGPVSMGVISGDSGGGGGPVVLESLNADFRLAIAKTLLEELVKEYKKRHSLKLIIYSSADFGESLPAVAGTKTAIKHTPVVSLAADEITMLNERIEQKTRNQITKRINNGVKVSEGSRDDLEEYREIQKGLVIKKYLSARHLNSISSLQNVWDNLFPKGMIRLYLAKKDEKLLGGAIIMYSQKGLLYKSGVLTEEGRNLYAGNALQWEIIRSAIAEGYRIYNMSGGVKDESDSMHGITKFKLSFGGELKPFIRYSASGNRTLKFIIYRLLRLFGRNEWFPLVIYP